MKAFFILILISNLFCGSAHAVDPSSLFNHLLANPTAKIDSDPRNLEHNPKLELYNLLQAMHIEDTYVPSQLAGGLMQALSIQLSKNESNINLIIDYWIEGKVWRVANVSLSDLINDPKGPFCLNLTVDGSDYGQYGNRDAPPLGLTIEMQDNSKANFYLNDHSKLVMGLSDMTRWDRLDAQTKEDMALAPIIGTSMSKFRRHDYSRPVYLKNCAKYLGPS